MKHCLALACVFNVTAAAAGGLDQSGQPMALLFKDGNNAEIAVGGWWPTVEGADDDGVGSGNVYGSISDLFAGVKLDIAPQWSVALLLDQPYGVNLDYPDGAFPYAGTKADADTVAATALVRWRGPSGFALHGGLRAERLGAEVTLDGSAYGPLAGYRWTGDDDWGFGWVAGASWERPELGMRVALTYGSEIRHDLDSTENYFRASTTRVTMPQSVNLDFQTGLDPRTLLYGSVRWVEWDGWDVSPPGLAAAAGSSLVMLESNAWTYRIGIGRQLTTAFSAGVELAHETAVDARQSPLSPYDGFTALSVGSTYALPSGLRLSGSVGYQWLGNADVAAPLYPVVGEFGDNHAVAAQVRVGMSF